MSAWLYYAQRAPAGPSSPLALKDHLIRRESVVSRQLKKNKKTQALRCI